MAVIDSIPEENYDRKVIVILPKDVYNDCQYDKLHGADGVCVLTKPFPDKVKSNPLFQNIVDAGITTDAPLIQNPFSIDDYALANPSILLDNGFAKYMGFVTLCGKLGAKSVVIDEKSLDRQLDDFRGTADAEICHYGAKGDVEKKIKTTKEKLLGINAAFYEDERNIAKATEYARALHLTTDPSIKSLIEARNQRGGLSKLSWKLSLTKETQGNLKIAAGLKIPIYADVNITLDKLSQTESELTINVDIEFWK
jgi:hypothetical protein